MTRALARIEVLTALLHSPALGPASRAVVAGLRRALLLTLVREVRP